MTQASDAKTGRQEDFAESILRADDPRIACYSCKAYNHTLREFKAKALGWFVQFAIRADLHEAWNHLSCFDDWHVQMKGYPELYLRARDLHALIRKRHVVDEPGLAEIGLSLYNFPTISHFFAAPSQRSFVREATLREIASYFDATREIVLKSPLRQYVPDASSPAEGLGDLVATRTRSQIERTASLPPEQMSRERLLVVDLTAPIALLKVHFLEAIKTFDWQKSSFECLYPMWQKYGVLPYLDLSQWVTREADLKISQPVQAELFYEREDAKDSSYLHDNTIGGSTEPYARRMLDCDSQPFRALLAAASLEYQQTISDVIGNTSERLNEMAEEAVHRWFPRTYPINLLELSRSERLMPEHAAKLRRIITELERSAAMTPSVRDRIRQDYNRADPDSSHREFINKIGHLSEVVFKAEYK